MSDRHEIANHLRVLYGHDNGGDAPGWLPIFTKPNNKTRWYPGDNLFGETPGEIVALAETQDVYHSVCLHQHPVAGRGKAANSVAMAGCWFDLDVRGPTHKSTALPATHEAARDWLAMIDLEPTLVIDSGHGYHAWWCFRRLQIFRHDGDRQIAAALSARFQDRLRTLAAGRGWDLDNTSDLARVLRVAGTLNHKLPPPLAVRTVYRSDARYLVRELLTFARGSAPSLPLHA